MPIESSPPITYPAATPTPAPLPEPTPIPTTPTPSAPAPLTWEDWLNWWRTGGGFQPMAEGGVVGIVGEKGWEYAQLPPGTIIAPPQNPFESPSMAGANQAFSREKQEAGLRPFLTGGLVPQPPRVPTPGDLAHRQATRETTRQRRENEANRLHPPPPPDRLSQSRHTRIRGSGSYNPETGGYTDISQGAPGARFSEEGGLGGKPPTWNPVTPRPIPAPNPPPTPTPAPRPEESAPPMDQIAQFVNPETLRDIENQLLTLQAYENTPQYIYERLQAMFPQVNPAHFVQLLDTWYGVAGPLTSQGNLGSSQGVRDEISRLTDMLAMTLSPDRQNAINAQISNLRNSLTSVERQEQDARDAAAREEERAWYEETYGGGLEGAQEGMVVLPGTVPPPTTPQSLIPPGQRNLPSEPGSLSNSLPQPTWEPRTKDTETGETETDKVYQSDLIRKQMNALRQALALALSPARQRQIQSQIDNLELELVGQLRKEDEAASIEWREEGRKYNEELYEKSKAEAEAENNRIAKENKRLAAKDEAAVDDITGLPASEGGLGVETPTGPGLGAVAGQSAQVIGWPGLDANERMVVNWDTGKVSIVDKTTNKVLYDWDYATGTGTWKEGVSIMTWENFQSMWNAEQVTVGTPYTTTTPTPTTPPQTTQTAQPQGKMYIDTATGMAYFVAANGQQYRYIPGRPDISTFDPVNDPEWLNMVGGAPTTFDSRVQQTF